MIDTRMQAPTKRKKRDKLEVYQMHKADSMTVAEAYDSVDPDKANRIRSCSTLVSRETYADERQRYVAFHCCVRLCSVCTWRRSEKIAAQMFKVAAAVREDYPDYRYIFVTFTQRNVMPEQLEAELSAVSRAFYRMTQTKPFIKAVKGFCRSIEITHNLKYNTFHPHIHAIFVVHRNYFTGPDYLDHDAWIAMWRKAMRLDYDPNVDVRRVKGNLERAIVEASKYAVKSADYIIPEDWSFTVETVRLLNSALHRKRFFSLGGVFKAYHKKLNLSDPEDPQEDKPAGEEPVKVEHYAWFNPYKQYRKIYL